MKEEVIQIMVQQWSLPEELVRPFIDDLLASGEQGKETLAELREASAALLQDIILKSLNSNLD